MITIIHGDDIVSSRNFFLDLKKSSDNPITINEKNLNFTTILQLLKGSGLFDEQKDIFIEELLSSKKIIADSEKIIDLIKNSKDRNVNFWEKNELTKTNLSAFPNAKVKLFKVPQNLFYFLDNIKPNNKNNVINFHKTLDSTDADAVFYMMLRQFRLLIVLRSQDLALSGTDDLQIDEIKRLAPWQKDKLKRQASFFSAGELKSIYNKLFEIDLKIKVGEITNLSRAIDIFLLEI